MNITIKNNNIYYYNYKIFNNEISWILIPIMILFILNKKYIKYVSYVMITIALIGTIETYYKYLKYRYFWFFSFVALLHLILLYPLLNIDKYLKPNITNTLLEIGGVFIIYFWPYWPYELSKSIMMCLLLFSYILTFIIYYLNFIIIECYIIYSI